MNCCQEKAFGWLVIGTGRIANMVMREITHTGRHKVVAVFSRTQAKAHAFAERYGATVFTDLKSALHFEGVQGVYIATPHSAHYKYMLVCIDEGVPVLSEKAFTVNCKQAEIVFERAAQKGVYVSEAMWMRYNPVIKEICKWVADGKIGDIKEIYANFCLPVSLAKPFMSDRVYTAKYAGGALLDLGVYPISYCNMLLGSPDKIDCAMRIENGVDYDCKITLSYKSATCRLCASFDELKTYHSRIIGTKGEIKSNMFYKPTRATLYIEGKKIEKRKCKRGYIYQFDGVKDDILAGKKSSVLMPPNDTLDVMNIMDICREQGGLHYPEEIECV